MRKSFDELVNEYVKRFGFIPICSDPTPEELEQALKDNKPLDNSAPAGAVI